MEHNKFGFLDFLVYFLILSSLLFISIRYFNADNGKLAKVFISGKLVKIIPLNKNSAYIFHGKLGKFIVQVKEGKIGVFETNCPEKICKKMGFINKKGSEIICIPNRIMIKITGESRIDEISR